MKYGFGYESDFSDPMDEIEEKGLKELFPNVNFADEVKFRIAHPDQDQGLDQVLDDGSDKKYPLWEKDPNLSINCGLLKKDLNKGIWPRPDGRAWARRAQAPRFFADSDSD